MPNHITNQLSILDLGTHSKNEIFSFCLNDKNQFDFNQISPKPDVLKSFEPHCGIISRAQNAMGMNVSDNELLSNLERSNRVRDCFTPIDPKEIDLVIHAIQAYRDTGYFYWYEFCNDVWGTKWNAYEQPEEGYSCDDEVIEFQTAWSTPEAIFNKLSKTFPTATFQIRYADEDLGSNCGTVVLKNGEIIKSDLAPRWSEQSEDDHRKWRKFAFELCHPESNPKDMGFDENFNYIEE